MMRALKPKQWSRAGRCSSSGYTGKERFIGAAVIDADRDFLSEESMTVESFLREECCCLMGSGIGFSSTSKTRAIFVLFFSC